MNAGFVCAEEIDTGCKKWSSEKKKRTLKKKKALAKNAERNIDRMSVKRANKIGYMSRVLASVTMPHSRMPGNELVRHNGDITLTMLAPSSVGLPFGVYPRLIMVYLVTTALHSGSRVIDLGRSLSEFFSKLGLDPSGGKSGNIRPFRDQMHRLFSATISVQYADMDHVGINKVVPLGPDDIERVLVTMDDAYGALEEVMTSTSLLADLHRAKRAADFANVHLLIELKRVLGIAGEMLKKEKRDIRLTADLDAWPRDLAIRGNQKMLSMMVNNILSNAVKYTPDGKGVRVTAKREAGFAVLEVADEGIGIPGDKMKAIFEPYFALESVNHHSTGKYKFMGGGIGLGLTVSRLIMEYHGGTLTIDSPGEGMGTNVMLRFPLTGTEQSSCIPEQAPPVEEG